jgi:hypothetical protein
MRRVVMFSLVAVLCVGAAFVIGAGPRQEAEEPGEEIGGDVEREIAVEDLPDPVREVVLREAGQHPVRDIDEVHRMGTLVYEAEWIDGSNQVEVTVTPTGEILGREIEPADEGDDEG